MAAPDGIERVLRRLETRGRLDEGDREALRSLPFICRTLDSAAYIVREGEPTQTCAILLTGFAYRHKVTGGGERQILSVHMAGEFLDLQNSFLGIADHNVQALTRCEIAAVPVPALRALTEAQEAPVGIGDAAQRETGSEVLILEVSVVTDLQRRCTRATNVDAGA